MSLQNLFRCIQPELQILFHEQNSVSVTTTIFIPVTSAKFLSPDFQESLQILLKQFFHNHQFSGEDEEDFKTDLNLKEEIDTDQENFNTENTDNEDEFEPKPKTEENESIPSVIGFKREGQGGGGDKKKARVSKGNFKCQECGKEYTSHKNFIKHTTQCEGTNATAHICQICGVQLASKYNLKGHMENVHGEKKFDCDECDYKAASESSLSNHKKNAHGNKVHVCDHCGFSSTHKATLKVHLQTHMKRNPVTCSICGKSVLSLT